MQGYLFHAKIKEELTFDPLEGLAFEISSYNSTTPITTSNTLKQWRREVGINGEERKHLKRGNH